MMMRDIEGEQWPLALELTGLRRDCMLLPSLRSATMLVSSWIGAIEVGILTAHEAAVLVV